MRAIREMDCADVYSQIQCAAGGGGLSSAAVGGSWEKWAGRRNVGIYTFLCGARGEGASGSRGRARATFIRVRAAREMYVNVYSAAHLS